MFENPHQSGFQPAGVFNKNSRVELSSQKSLSNLLLLILVRNEQKQKSFDTILIVLSSKSSWRKKKSPKELDTKMKVIWEWQACFYTVFFCDGTTIKYLIFSAASLQQHGFFAFYIFIPIVLHLSSINQRTNLAEKNKNVIMMMQILFSCSG